MRAMALLIPAAALLAAAAVALPEGGAVVLTPQELRRPAEQTYLTFPEWFLVFSPSEYADHLAERPPSEFPFLGHVGQFWQGYLAVYSATKDRYPFNPGYHAMVLVIGTSTTVEYGLKSAWETLVGRLTEMAGGGAVTDEDGLAARAARDYVEFLDLEPWYRYDFLSDVASLWTETGLWGPGLIRKWERKYYLTSEYLAKAVYGWIIGGATGAAYEAASPVTAVVLDMLPEGVEKDLPGLEVLDDLTAGGVLTSVPRYAPFKDYAAQLGRRGVTFIEIAGNRGEILVSLLAPADWSAGTAPGRVIFTQPILTRTSTKRVVLAVEVPTLGRALVELDKPLLRLEHVYDY